MKQYFLYILTNKNNSIFYIGVTYNLLRRVYEHKHKMIKGFTEKYNVEKLIYYEETNSIESAITREKQLKNWHRQWKINLVAKVNPKFNEILLEQMSS